MDTPNNKNFILNLAQYSTLAMALASATDTNGQIIYTDVDPDITTAYYNLDLNNDSTDDFQFDITNSFGTWFNLQPQNSNAALGEYGFWYNSLNVLNNDQVISFGLSEWVSGWLFMCNGAWGGWCGKTDKYIGLRLKIGLNIHYGWVRLDVNMKTFTIKDYAYNITPGESINAGQTVLSIDDLDPKEIKVISLANRINLYNLPQPLEYKIFSLTGQLVLDGKTKETTYTIHTNALTKGVYVIELFDKQWKSTLKKKIVI
ncbi:T9SS type A sorting domain-containing protein [Mangrovimonas xylaniphaga]|uniref:T9SS type A sorting domain-containing protein n=1 Tax=Mangrovimonas xylaniphaga TaxID=1645915 RepID=UPI0006B5808D|nr:T9SS type A sorting domain-containing protein [Mangrovimonas xylaniphaga]